MVERKSSVLSGSYLLDDCDAADDLSLPHEDKDDREHREGDADDCGDLVVDRLVLSRGAKPGGRRVGDGAEGVGGVGHARRELHDDARVEAVEPARLVAEVGLGLGVRVRVGVGVGGSGFGVGVGARGKDGVSRRVPCSRGRRRV